MRICDSTRVLAISGLLIWGEGSPADPPEDRILRELSSSAKARIGIVFSRPKSVAAGRSMRLPATVTVPPRSRELVSAPYSGIVVKAHHAVGERVEAGAILVEIRSAELVAMKSTLRRARAAYALASKNLERDRVLAREGAIAGRRLDATRTDYETARVEFEAIRSRLRALGVDSDQTERREVRGGPADTISVTSSIDGVVIAKLVDIGERVEAMTPLYRLADPGQLWLEARIPIEQTERVRHGDTLTVDAPDGTTVSGTVMLVGGIVDAGTDTVLVRAELPVGNRALRPGQFVIARWHDRSAPGFEVPAAAVVRIGEQEYVFAQRASALQAVPVVLGTRGTETVRVLSGLTASDRVVVSGAAQLKALWSKGRGSP